MLNVKNISFCYNSNPVLDDISFEINKGELCGLFGPNGCGKTTLFKCCLKFLNSSDGSILIDGNNIEELKTKNLARLVAYVPQEHKPPFPYLVKEIVLMGRTPHLGGFFGISRKDREVALEALELLNIAHLHDRPYNQLSGGQRQMVLIARAIAQETKLIFLDEPTSALDFKNQIIIWESMRRVVKKGITILACSHDPNHVAWFCDKVVVMNESGILAKGSPSKVITQEILDEIYRDICDVRDLGSTKMVLPNGVVRPSISTGRERVYA